MAARPKCTVLFYHPSMENLAKKVVEDPAYAGRIRLGSCSWESFADGFPNILLDPQDSIALDTEYLDAAYLGSFAKPEVCGPALASMSMTSRASDS